MLGAKGPHGHRPATKDELSDSALVARGGIPETQLPRFVDSALDAADDDNVGFFAVSVWASDTKSLLQLCADAPIPNGQVMTGTAGRIREAGFELVKTGEPDHYDVALAPLDMDRASVDREFLTGAAARLVAAFFPVPSRNPLKLESK